MAQTAPSYPLHLGWSRLQSRFNESLSLLLPLLLAAGVGCKAERGRNREAPPPAEAKLPEGFAVRDGDPTLLFQFYDPSQGLTVTHSVAEVPAQYRSNVMVLCSAFKKGDVPPELVIIADLSRANSDGTYPYRLASRYDVSFAVKLGEGVVLDTPSESQVILFSATWCPHCRSARRWLEFNNVPFVEKNVEEDPQAAALLMSLGKKQGMSPEMLTSVPIFYVNGRLIIGFNPQELSALLSR